MFEPKVSIIVTSYLPESKRFLDLCMRSIEQLDYKNKEVIVVGRPDYKPEYPNAKTVSPTQDKFWPPVGLNCGIAHATGEYFFVLNDDVILTKDCLTKLVHHYETLNSLGVLMPISNDQQGRYCAPALGLMGPQSYERMAPETPNLIHTPSPYPPALSFHDTLCIYSFLVSRQTHRRIGAFDESLIGQDDIDYTLRARQLGLNNAVAYDSIVWHFGGSSADKTFSHENRVESMKRFHEKWS